MKTDIILSGVGGQGIVTIAAIIGTAALKNNIYIKQSEVHGMSQRGGAVQSHLRISEKPIDSDLIPFGHADLILSVEPLESLRYLPYLSFKGCLVTNSNPFINIPDYPDLQLILDEIKILKNYFYLDADALAREIKSPRSSNVLMLGAASSYIFLGEELLREGIREVFKNKDEEVINQNLTAFDTGKKYVENQKIQV
ncbi:MAG: indolepyruvate oxidoreductase subunit beta [Bacteroidales bacterium]